MKTIAQQLNIKEFPFEIKDKKGNVIYTEYPNGNWFKPKYDSYGNPTRYENSNGNIENRGPKDGKAAVGSSDVKAAIMRIVKECSYNAMGDGGGHTVVKVNTDKFYNMIVGYVNGL